MEPTAQEISDSHDRDLLIKWIKDAVRRLMVHYGLWFVETERQLGMDAALMAESEAGDRFWEYFMQRVGRAMGFEAKDGAPAALYEMSTKTLRDLLDALSKNWLMADGVWFQAVEGLSTMDDAKRVNDTCWTRFSPYEAFRIKSLLGLPEAGGLPALKTALIHRLYSRVNVQEIVEESETSFVFRMRECRVQVARKRKGLADYPCKSGGMVEYRGFARAIDPAISTECVACPPDEHPEEWYCAWRFTLAE